MDALQDLINSMHGAATAQPAAPMPLMTPSHFLDLPHHVQPGPELDGIVPDTSTVAAHDFDVDVNTGFMPTYAPLTRFPAEVGDLMVWERVLDEGLALGMKLGDQLGRFAPEETEKNERWRASVRAVRIIILSPVVYLAHRAVACDRCQFWTRFRLGPTSSYSVAGIMSLSSSCTYISTPLPRLPNLHHT